MTFTTVKRLFNKLKPISFEKIHINDNFWLKRQQINRDISIHHQYEKLEQDFHIENFRVASGIKKGVQIGEFYFDSDLYKWLEAASNILYTHKDADLEKNVSEIVNLIKNSQTQDGYINTFYSIRFLHKRFTNINTMHELYCAGHLIQAAIAHKKATGSIELLEVAIKFADLLVNLFLDGKRKCVPGHEEIEMALIELYRITENSKYLRLAEEFINRRGNFPNFKTYAINQYLGMISTLNLAEKKNKEYQKAAELPLDITSKKPEVNEWVSKLTLKDQLILLKEYLNGNFNQSNAPVRQIIEPVGHAVRAMYLYCGMADLFSETGDKNLLHALKRVWIKMVKARMYITGGIGSERSAEGFKKDFALKNEDSYSETCAAIGNMMWNLRMLQITGNCKYADLIELLMYNAMLVGQSIDGIGYTYDNPLVSHGKDKRFEWFRCACCPPNIARTISSLGNYIYSTSEKGLWIHQFIGNDVNIELGSNTIEVSQKTGFPWKGDVNIKLNLAKSQKFSIFLRIPRWSIETELKINAEQYFDGLSSGKYVEIIRNWLDKDRLDISFKMNAKFVESDQRIKNNRGRVAISYGPLIYCLEQKDNKDFDIFTATLKKDQELNVKYRPEMLGGVNTILGKDTSGKNFSAIPYYAWNNRGLDKMQIWHLAE
ncbi:MAG: glycoside hydrolase family 127 protein [Candidatus Lokiarchaeota archaeon]|nr:glycoside hydrolase family 127 protein [Candidatus Lokiarchaeota archaeon]